MGKVMLLSELYFNRTPLVGVVTILEIAKVDIARLITGYCNNFNKTMMPSSKECVEV